MRNLFEEIMGIIKKYRIDAIYYSDGLHYTRDEAEQAQMRQLENYLASLPDYASVALYGGGLYCENIFSALKSLHGNISCIIDNFTSKIGDEKGIAVVNIDDFLLTKEKDVEAVLITSWDYHEAFECELKLVDYRGDIIDIPAWMMRHFPDLKRPIYEYRNGKMHYEQINEMELLYREAADAKKRYTILKKIIYALCIIKDFLYAEKYIAEMELHFAEFGESGQYRCAINEIKELMELCAKQRGKDVLFIHVIDSLAEFVVDKMPWLNAHSKEGIRFRGIINQYAHTHYALNQMFTGKSVFDMERTSENIEWDDSELLKMIREKYSINVASGIAHIMAMFKKVNDNAETVYPDYFPKFTLTEALFEMLALWGKKNYRNIILVHSCGEVHIPYYRIGSSSKLINYADMKSKKQFERQFEEALAYADEELAWYDYFYDLTNMPMITMGDHGNSPELEFQFFCGVKKDLPTRAIKEANNPALIINRIRSEKKEINGLISNIKIPLIIRAILEDDWGLIENISTDTVELQAVPGYGEAYCKRFMGRGIWGQYEGFSGIMTDDEIYLISETGRELYFRPNECRYRNLVKNPMYSAGLAECRNKLGHNVFPMDILKLKQYKSHFEQLELYDMECYQKLMERLKNQRFFNPEFGAAPKLEPLAAPEGQ